MNENPTNDMVTVRLRVDLTVTVSQSAWAGEWELGPANAHAVRTDLREYIKANVVEGVTSTVVESLGGTVTPTVVEPDENGLVPTAVTDLWPTDVIDLAGDPYADRGHGQDGHECPFEFELTTVADPPGERETEDTYRLDYEGGACGFPPDHTVPARRRTPARPDPWL